MYVCTQTHRNTHTPCFSFHDVITLFSLTYILDMLTWHHILRLHSFMLCGSVITYLSSPQALDLSLKVWSSSGIPYAENGITIHSHEYNRNLEITLDFFPREIVSGNSPSKIQPPTHPYCCLSLNTFFQTSPHHHSREEGDLFLPILDC